MKHYLNEDIDCLIKEAVCDMVESATPPPFEDSWAKFEQKHLAQLNPQIPSSSNTGQRISIFKRLAIAAGIIVFLTAGITVSFPQNARAIGEKIVNAISYLIGSNKVNIGTSYNNRENSSLNDDIIEIPVGQELVISLNEAKSLTPFEIVTPKYLPPGYKLDELVLQELIQPYLVVKVTLKYVGDTGYFTIFQENTPGEYGAGQGYDTDDTIKESFEMEQKKGDLFTHKSGKVKANWLNQGMLFRIEGNISKNETLKIIESM